MMLSDGSVRLHVTRDFSSRRQRWAGNAFFSLFGNGMLSWEMQPTIDKPAPGIPKGFPQPNGCAFAITD